MRADRSYRGGACLDTISLAYFLYLTIADTEAVAFVRAQCARKVQRDVHEFMNEDLGLFTLIKFVKPLMHYLDDIGHGESCNLSEYLAISPDACDSACFRIEAPYTKDTIGLHMIKANPRDQQVNACLDIGSERVLHLSQYISLRSKHIRCSL